VGRPLKQRAFSGFPNAGIERICPKIFRTPARQGGMPGSFADSVSLRQTKIHAFYIVSIRLQPDILKFYMRKILYSPYHTSWRCKKYFDIAEIFSTKMPN